MLRSTRATRAMVSPVRLEILGSYGGPSRKWNRDAEMGMPRLSRNARARISCSFGRRRVLASSKKTQMIDLLLTHGYFLHEDPKELQIMKPYPPLGILYICSHLRAKGFRVEVFDSTFSSRQELFHVLQKGPPSILG